MSPEYNEFKELVLFPYNFSLAVARGIGRLLVETYDGIVGHIDEPKKDL